MKSVVVLFSLLASSAIFAATPGKVLNTFQSPNGLREVCSAPRALDLAASERAGISTTAPLSTTELESATQSCSYDFYDCRETTKNGVAIVVCPKFGSTNPSLMFNEIPMGTTRHDFLEKQYRKNRRDGLVAKFKQSISCSYTPAILAYPRVGRMLKSEIEFPYTTYRTMDLKEHLKIATEAKDVAAELNGFDSLIAQTWRMLYRSDIKPSTYGSQLYTENNTQIYGAIVPYLPNDEFYGAANGATKGDRLAHFQNTLAFKRVTWTLPVHQWGLEQEARADVIQKLILLRELGDMIVLDTLLNQADRLGNLHYRDHLVHIGNNGSHHWVLASELSDSEKAAYGSSGYVPVKRMLLADNDCGVKKENIFGGAHIAEKVKHLHSDTYHAVQAMARLATLGQLGQYLKSDLLFTNVDVKSVEKNLLSMAADFKKRCKAGTLFLDADVSMFLGYAQPNQSCE